MKMSAWFTYYRFRLSNLFLLLVFLITLSACASNCEIQEPFVITGEQSDIVDRSLLTQEPCAPPCWFDITPGITIDTEAYTILSDLKFINPDTLEIRRDRQGGGIYWETVFEEDRGATTRGVIFDKQGIVSRIYVPRLWYHITLNDLIEVMGEPDGVIVRLKYGTAETSNDCLQASAVWFRDGLEVSLAELVPASQSNTLSVNVDPDTLIQSATYMPSTSGIDEYSQLNEDASLKKFFTAWGSQ